MILQARKTPAFNELVATLRVQFSDYAVYTCHSIPQKSIIVRKSATVGAQITIRDSEILVDACCPNIFISALVGFASTIFPPYHTFESKITDFLRKKYD